MYLSKSYINTFESKKQVSSLQNKICFVLSALFFVFITTPYIMSYYIIIPVVACSLFWVISFKAFFNSKIIKTAFIFPLLFFAFEIVYLLIGYSSASIGNYIIVYLSISAVWIVFYLFKYINERYIMHLLFIVFLSIFVSLLFGFYYHFRYEYFNIDVNPKAYGKVNAGNIGFNYGVLFFSLISFYMLQGRRLANKIIKMLALTFWVVSFAYCMICSQSATIVISCLLGAFLIIFFVFNKTRTFKKTFICMLIVSFLFLFLLIPNFFLEAAYTMFGTKIGDRFSTIIAVVNGNTNSVDNSRLLRFDFLKLDFEYWLESPKSFFIGWGFHLPKADDTVSFAEISKSGGHSLLLDQLPRYGLIGFSLFIMAILRIKREISKCDLKQNSTLIRIISYLFLFNSVFNSFIHPCSFLSVTIILLFSKVFYRVKQKQF